MKDILPKLRAYVEIQRHQREADLDAVRAMKNVLRVKVPQQDRDKFLCWGGLNLRGNRRAMLETVCRDQTGKHEIWLTGLDDDVDAVMIKMVWPCLS